MCSSCSRLFGTRFYSRADKQWHNNHHRMFPICCLPTPGTVSQCGPESQDPNRGKDEPQRTYPRGRVDSLCCVVNGNETRVQVRSCRSSSFFYFFKYQASMNMHVGFAVKRLSAECEAQDLALSVIIVVGRPNNIHLKTLDVLLQDTSSNGIQCSWPLAAALVEKME